MRREFFLRNTRYLGRLPAEERVFLMATQELNSENLDATIADNDIVVIDFWAPWCGPCKQFGPVFEKVSEKYPEIRFMKCNTEEQQEVAGAFGIRSIPTTAIFREQLLLFMQPGALPESALVELLDQVKTLNMEEVRKEIEAHEKENSCGHGCGCHEH